MNDPFVGAWTLNPARSQYDANHRPSQGTMRWQVDTDGAYLLLAEGADEKGRPCREKPQRMLADGKPYAVESMPGLTCVTTRPNTRTLRAEVKREDGSLAGEGTYVVAEDGATLTATTSGFDSQLRQFTIRSVWERA
jgi:hypothetical protein